MEKKKQRRTRYTGFYFLLAFVCLAWGCLCLWEAGTTMFVEREFWDTVRNQLITDSVQIPAHRGNIYSADGEVLSTTLPEYRICMDFVVEDRHDTLAMNKGQRWRDSVYAEKLDSICDGLHRIFPEMTAQSFRTRLENGRKNRRRNLKVHPSRVTYVQYKQCKELPLFRERPYKGGFYAEELPQRKKPYGSLASRVLGAMFAEKDSARFGLELSFDSILRGTPGYKHVTKVRNRRLSFVDKAPIDGHDLMTTLDIGIQDAAEKSLVAKLKEINGEMGVAILMECATGDVKAMVNMAKCGDGQYREVKNSALLDRMEPGSTFKTASIMVALEDGKIDTCDRIDCAPGVRIMYKRRMTDHNHHRGGYGVLTATQTLMYSSNIGVSGFIDKYYHNNPEKYVDGLYRMGIGRDLNLPFEGAVKPIVRRPTKENWYATALAWMSIGYETQITPMHTLAFYNAIANNGRFVKPRFVKAEMCDGQVVREFPTEVFVDKICSDKTLEKIHFCLEQVVSNGLGKKAGNGGRLFKVSGKTGTAQVADEHGGYHSGMPRYLISFCGFFPSDNPKYSCIVAIRKNGLPASGGGMCGPVFRDISMAVMAKGNYRAPLSARDSTSELVPVVKGGDEMRTRRVMEILGKPVSDLQPTPQPSVPKNGVAIVPDLTGMGARDVLSYLSRAGLKCKIRGTGHVHHQNYAPGMKVKDGTTVEVELS